MKLNIKKAHWFVNWQQRKDKDFYWEGWDIVHFEQNPEGYYSKAGVFRDGRWGFLTRFRVNDSGEWNIDPKLIQFN